MTHDPEGRKVLILIGPTRTGTTSLFRFLAGDGDAFAASRVKETNLFLTRDAAETDDRSPDALRSSFLRQIADDRPDRVLLEASPLYFAGGRTVATRIAAAFERDDVKVLATVREPVARFVSLYHHVVTKRAVNEAPPPFPAFVDDALAMRNRLGEASLDDASRHAFNEGRYGELLTAWSEVLGPEATRVVTFDALADEHGRAGLLRELYAWIGHAPTPHLDAPYPSENRTRHVRSRGLHAVALGVNRALEPLLNRRPGVRDALRRVYYRFTEDAKRAAPLDAAALERVRAAYREVEQGSARAIDALRLCPPPDWLAKD